MTRNPYVRGALWGVGLALLVALSGVVPEGTRAWVRATQASDDPPETVQASGIEIELYAAPAAVKDPASPWDVADLDHLHGEPFEEVADALTGQGERITDGGLGAEWTKLYGTPRLLGGLADCERVVAFPVKGPGGGLVLVGLMYGHAHVVAHLPESMQNGLPTPRHQVVWFGGA